MNCRTILTALAVALISCQGDLTRKQLLDYTTDVKNGLCKKQEKLGTQLEVIYRPSQLMAEAQIRNEELSDRQIDSIRATFKEIDYFLLRISRNSREIENSYSGDSRNFQRINNYLSFEIGGDIYLVQSRDTLRVTDFVRTQTFGASPSTDILLAFKPGFSKRSIDIKVVFNDTKFDTGVNEFLFDIDDITRVSDIQIIDKIHEAD